MGSMVGAAFFDAVLAGKRPQVIGRADQPHSFTFIDDFARALVLLGEREDAYGRVWHVPTSEPLTITALAELIAGEAGTKARAPAVLSGLPLRLVSKVVPIVAALADVQYQTTAPFVTDGSRFARAFGFTPTEHREAVRQTIRWLRARVDAPSTARRRVAH
jgi:nucleoside-diphosphate-sugar epimerase